jgi:hypothetical protein
MDWVMSMVVRFQRVHFSRMSVANVHHPALHEIFTRRCLPCSRRVSWDAAYASAEQMQWNLLKSTLVFLIHSWNGSDVNT